MPTAEHIEGTATTPRRPARRVRRDRRPARRLARRDAPQVRQADLPLRAGRRPGPPRLGAGPPGRRQDGDAGDSARGAGGDAHADRRAQAVQGVVAASGGGERGAVPGAAQGRPGRGAGRPKRGLRDTLTEAFAADIAAEIDALVGPGVADGIDLETLETAVRRQALGLAAQLVERRLNADRGDRTGPSLPCGGCGGRAVYAGRRPKAVTTVLGPICASSAPTTTAPACNAGFHPRDRALGVEGVVAVARRGPHDGPRGGARELRGDGRAAPRPRRRERRRQAGGAHRRGAGPRGRGGRARRRRGRAGPGADHVPRHGRHRRAGAQGGAGRPRRQAGRRLGEDPRGEAGRGVGGARPTRTAANCPNGSPARSATPRRSRAPPPATPTPNSRRSRCACEREARRRGFHLARPPGRASATARRGSGTSPTSCSRARSRSSTCSTPSSTCGTSPRPSTGPAPTRRNDGRNAAATNSTTAGSAPCCARCAATRGATRRGAASTTSRRNRHRMRYPAFRAHGPCASASGVLEAGCKHVVGTRCKRPGMHWSVTGVNAMLALRCLRPQQPLRRLLDSGYARSAA